MIEKKIATEVRRRRRRRIEEGGGRGGGGGKRRGRERLTASIETHVKCASVICDTNWTNKHNTIQIIKHEIKAA